MANGNDWSEGTYVLTVDKWTEPVYEGEGLNRTQVDERYWVKGDEVELDAREARRLGESGGIAPEGSSAAKAAQGIISEEALVATSQLSLEEKKAQIEALKRQIEEEEAEVERLEDEDLEPYPIPVAGHPGTPHPAGDPDNQEDFTKSAASRRRGNRVRSEEDAQSAGPTGKTEKAAAKGK